MSILPFAIGVYFIWFALRVSVFNYDSEAQVRAGTSKDKQIYWGALPIMIIGILICGGVIVV